MRVTAVALAAWKGLDATVDDDLAYVIPWGCDPTRMAAPILFMHGGEDRMVPSTHSQWLANHCQTAELRLSPTDGHVSVLNHAEAALEWLRNHATV